MRKDVQLQLSDKTDAFIEYERSRDLSERSLKELRSILVKFADYSREKGIADISLHTTPFLKSFILYQNPTGSPSQSKMLIWALRKFFSWLVLNKDITLNPAASIPHPKIPRREHLPDYLTPGELDALMRSAFEDFTIKEATIIALMNTTGLRPKEVTSLQVKNVNVDDEIIFTKVKGGWYKRGPITHAMAQQFRHYFDATGISEGPVFRNRWNDPIDTSWIRRMIDRVSQKAEIDRKITPRMLRHTFGTYAAQRHGKTVTRALLGHCATSHSTEVYMHLLPDRFRPLMQMHPFSEQSWRPDKRDRDVTRLVKNNQNTHFILSRNSVAKYPEGSLSDETEAILSSFLEYYQKIRNVTTSTIKSVKSMCRRWACYLCVGRNRTLTTASAEDVVAWIVYQQQRPHIKDRTIEHQLCIIRTFHDYIIKFEGPASAPCEGLPSFICRSSYERQHLTVDEVFAMLATFDRQDPVEYQKYLIVAFLWSTGLRTTEFLSLLWKDINLKEGIVRVRVGKGRKERLLFLPSRIHQSLKQYKKNILAAASGPVFVPITKTARPDQLHKPFTSARLAGILTKAATTAGISRKVNPITLRHTFATHLYEAGVGTKDIQEMMGHANNQETTIYIHVTVKAAKQLLNKHVYHTLQFRGKDE